MFLTPHDIARMLDHSTLQPFLTEDDIRRGCELALKPTLRCRARPGPAAGTRPHCPGPIGRRGRAPAAV